MLCVIHIDVYGNGMILMTVYLHVFFHSIAARLLPIGVGLHTLTNPGLSPITNPALNPILHPALIPVQARIAALRARVAALVSLF